MEQMFKVGDKVRIKSKRRIYRETVASDGYREWSNSTVRWNDQMDELFGKEFTINSIVGKTVTGLDCKWTITTNMIEHVKDLESIEDEIKELEAAVEETNFRLEELNELLESIRESEKLEAVDNIALGDRVIMRWRDAADNEYIFARVGYDNESESSLYDLINLATGGQAMGGMKREILIKEIKKDIENKEIVKFEIISK